METEGAQETLDLSVKREQAESSCAQQGRPSVLVAPQVSAISLTKSTIVPLPTPTNHAFRKSLAWQ